MKRRTFISTALISGIGISAGAQIISKDQKFKEVRGSVSVSNFKTSVFTNADVQPTRIFHITDTHLSMDDERGVPFQSFSGRMAGAYQKNKHFSTSEIVTTKESFHNTLEIAKQENADFLALTGDIFSFPSEAAIEWAYQELKSCGIPFAYIAGNHDWHYEGMKGSSHDLREKWTEERLKPLYQGNNPLFATYDINGIRFVCIDNSTYEITSEQLAFFQEQSKSGKPLILMMHIPLYIPGQGMGYGCGHPEWGAKSDKGYKVERREKWRTGGHTKTTFEFYNKVFAANNLLAILAGHTHRNCVDVKNGVPQIVTSHNATGAYLDIHVSSF